jgi:hypothetical protein
VVPPSFLSRYVRVEFLAELYFFVSHVLKYLLRASLFRISQVKTFDSP